MGDAQNPLAPTMKIYTTSEVAKILRVSTPTVRNLKKRGEIDAVAGLRTLRFSSSTVAAFINRKPRK
jgi:excisionase family DNA binding protein